MSSSIIQSPHSSDSSSRCSDNDDNDTNVAGSSPAADEGRRDSNDMAPTDCVPDNVIAASTVNKRRPTGVKSKKNKKLKAQETESSETVMFDDVVVSYTLDTMPAELKK